MPCSHLWQCLAALFLAFGVSTTAQELLGASQGFPALGELVGVIADEGELIDTAILNAWQHPSHPANISGSFSGAWQLQQNASEGIELAMAELGGGRLALQLTSTSTSVAGLHDIKGSLVLGAGVYASQEDLRFSIEGVYVAEAGQMRARLVLRQPQLQVSLGAHEAAKHTPDYRAALRAAAEEVLQQEEELEPGSQQQMSAPIEMQKTCEFALTAAVHSLHKGDLPAHGQNQGPALHPRRILSAQDGSQGDQPSADAVLNGTLVSANCGLKVTLGATTFRQEVYYAKAVNYTLLITTLSFLQVLMLIRQMEATSTQALAASVSLLCIGHQAILDAYLCLLHLTTGIIVEPLFNAFATAAFFEFVIFAIFEMRYLLAIWRARRAAADAWALQRELSVLYARFYGALVGGLLLIYHGQKRSWLLLFALHSFWLPQILYCVRSEARQPLKPYYVVGMTLSRLALPLYVFGCPHNLLHTKPQPWLCLGLCAYMGAQVAVLLAQARLGPRCFIPRRFLPPKYDYFRAASRRVPQGVSRGDVGAVGDIETGDAGVECVICMTPVDAARAKTRMVTPCGHFFHPGCLQRWMDIKLECPTCRQSLPPL